MGERMVCGRNSERAGLRAASVPLECAAWELCSAARGACEHGRSQLLSSVLVLGVSTSLCHRTVTRVIAVEVDTSCLLSNKM